MAEAAKQGKPWPPTRPAQSRAPGDGRADGGRSPHDDPVRARDQCSGHRCFVPSAGLLRIVGALGPAEDRAFWATAADVSRELFVRVTGPETGLAPDRSNFDMSPVTGRDGQPVPFGYDSWRTVSNWSVDYSWWHKDAQEPVLSERVQKFLFDQGMQTFADRYTLDGQPLSTRHSPGMVAAAAVGSSGGDARARHQRRSCRNCGTCRCRRASSVISTACSI